jgi:hypothetical protein
VYLQSSDEEVPIRDDNDLATGSLCKEKVWEFHILDGDGAADLEAG